MTLKKESMLPSLLILAAAVAAVVFLLAFYRSRQLESIPQETTDVSQNFAAPTVSTEEQIQAQLNIPGEGTNNMIWSWWYYPQVIATGESVYWGYGDNQGYSGIACYDRASGSITTNSLKKLESVDDHNGLALTLLEDGRILCAYSGGHNDNREIYIRVSSEPFRIDHFENTAVLTSQGLTCYAQILQHNGKIFVFYRVNNNGWAVRSSSDCVTWSEEILLIRADMQYYCKFVPTTREGLVRVCMNANPDAGNPQIRMGFYDLETGLFLNSDGKTELGSRDIHFTDVNILIPATEGKTQRLLDVAVTDPEVTRILFAPFTLDKSAKDSVYCLYDNGAVAQLCTGGDPLWNPKYMGGACFAGSDIYIARNQDGMDEIVAFRFSDDGSVTPVVLWEEAVGTGSNRNARPIASPDGSVILWHRGYYNSKVYTDFYTEAMIHFAE